jgi:hypothetical protein
MLSRLSQHAAIMKCRLRRIVHKMQEVESSAAALPLVIGAAEVFDQSGCQTGLLGQFVLKRPISASQVTGNCKTRIDGREQLCFLLDHLGKPFFNQAVQNLINLLPGDVGTGRQLERLESGMADKHKIRTRFIRIQSHLLKLPPTELKVGR